MPNFITKLFSSGATKLVEGIGGVLDELITSKDEKLAAELKIKELIAKHEVEMEREISSRWSAVYDGNSVDISGGFAIDTIGTSPTTVSVSWNKTQALGYAHYVSNLSQANANAPTEVVLENNTTRTLTWSYVGAGQYRAVFSTALVDIDKVTFDISPHFKSGPSGVDIVASSVTGFTVQTFVPSTGTVTDSILSNTTLTFKIYP